MRRQRRLVILLEFSELAPALVDQLPNFRRFRDESHVYVTDAQEEPKNLDPRIQWATVHTGLGFAEHGLDQKSIWDLASDDGLRVWVCGSLNARYHLPLNGCVLPDRWTTAIAPHGLPAATIGAIARAGSAAILDRLQWDLFRSYYHRMRPDLATFFVNSGASLDALLGRFLRLAGRDATLVLCTALGSKDGMRHPDGLCWIRTPDRTHVVAPGKVPLRALAPTVLQLLGVPIPARMTAASLLGERSAARDAAHQVAALV